MFAKSILKRVNRGVSEKGVGDSHRSRGGTNLPSSGERIFVLWKEGSSGKVMLRREKLRNYITLSRDEGITFPLREEEIKKGRIVFSDMRGGRDFPI